jgi:dihydropyrimidinase
MDVTGINVVTISQGKIVYRDGEPRTVKGAGRYIDRPPFPPYYDAMKLSEEANRLSSVRRI